MGSTWVAGKVLFADHPGADLTPPLQYVAAVAHQRLAFKHQELQDENVLTVVVRSGPPRHRECSNTRRNGNYGTTLGGWML